MVLAQDVGAHPPLRLDHDLLVQGGAEGLRGAALHLAAALVGVDHEAGIGRLDAAQDPQLAGAAVHGDAHPVLAKVKKFFDTVVEEMSEHLSREERFVFPAISAMERTGTAATNLDHELRALMAEHDAAGMLMRTIAELTDGFTSPDDACPSYQMMNERLAKFRSDLHLHVHKENNQLFPQALEYSKTLG